MKFIRSRKKQIFSSVARHPLLFDHLMRLRPPLVDGDKAGVLADKLMEQARANHDKLVQV